MLLTSEQYCTSTAPALQIPNVRIQQSQWQLADQMPCLPCCDGLPALPACSTFWLTATMGQTMSLNFTGTPSKVLRIWLPYADPTAELVLAVNMLQTPNRRFAWTEGRRRIDPLQQLPKIGDASGHGDFFWDQDTTLFTMKLKGGGSSVEIRSENAIAVTQRLAVSINDFFDTQSRFLANLVSEHCGHRDGCITAFGLQPKHNW